MLHPTCCRRQRSTLRGAWYPKPATTFSDALARLRRHLWLEHFAMSLGATDITEPIGPTVQRIVEVACYAP